MKKPKIKIPRSVIRDACDVFTIASLDSATRAVADLEKQERKDMEKCPNCGAHECATTAIDEYNRIANRWLCGTTRKTSGELTKSAECRIYELEAALERLRRENSVLTEALRADDEVFFRGRRIDFCADGWIVDGSRKMFATVTEALLWLADRPSGARPA